LGETARAVAGMKAAAQQYHDAMEAYLAFVRQ
jgi:hypothetical protein